MILKVQLALGGNVKVPHGYVQALIYNKSRSIIKEMPILLEVARQIFGDDLGGRKEFIEGALLMNNSIQVDKILPHSEWPRDW